MKEIYLVAKAAALVLCLSLLASCSYTVMPKSAPPVKEFSDLSLKDAFLIVTNAEKDASLYSIPNENGKNTALRTNRQKWSTLLVEALAGELAKRGARVSSRAALTMSLAVPEITFTQTRELSRYTVKVLVSSSTGWSKNYAVTAQAGPQGMETVTAMADRLAGQSLAEAVKAMLGDAEFTAQLGASAETHPLVSLPTGTSGQPEMK
jgi:uncharacterized lipoprotein YajG